MIGYSDDARLDELLVPLRRLEPVTLRERQAHRRWRPVLVATVVAAALAGTGVAIAAGFGVFNGIGAAQRPQTAADVFDPATLGLGQACPADFYSDFCHLVPDSVRLVGRLPGGHRVFVAASTRDNLCVLVEADGASCGPALDAARPITAVFGNNGTGDEFLAYGVAMDDVTAVSFTVAGHEVTVPVKDNVWFYEEQSAASLGRCVTAHLADGSTVNPFPKVPCP